MELTAQEAKEGCTKIISEGGLSMPLRFTVPKGTEDGAIFEIGNAEYNVDGGTIVQSLFVSIDIKKSEKELDEERKEALKKHKKKFRWGRLLLIVIAAAIVGTGIFFLIRYLHERNGTIANTTEVVSVEGDDAATGVSADDSENNADNEGGSNEGGAADRVPDTAQEPQP